MKRISFFAILMAVCVLTVQAQLEVDSVGNIGIGENASAFAKHSIKSNISNTTTISCTSSSQYGLWLHHSTPQNASSNSSGIYVYNYNSYGKNCGIRSMAYGAGNASTDSVAVGVLGLAGHTKYNVGVCGGLGSTSSSTNFAGIYGTKGMLGYVNFNSYTGHYAGFFYGNVRVTSGSIYATVLSPSATTNNGSMQNVNVISTDNIDGETVTNKLSQVQTIQFMRDKRELESVDEPVEIPADERARLTAEGVDVDAMQKEKRVDEPTLSAIQYGLAADQLKKVYPELVYEDKDGNVSVNYIEMIPLLVQSINELSSELAELKGTSSKKVKAQTTAVEETVEDIDQVRMDQNKPNPFSGSTVITLNIPESAKQASIYIYDLSGKQIQSLPVTERGETNITVYASGLSAGMYVYTLVVDGQVKVTRKMMVTE